MKYDHCKALQAKTTKKYYLFLVFKLKKSKLDVWNGKNIHLSWLQH